MSDFYSIRKKLRAKYAADEETEEQSDFQKIRSQLREKYYGSGPKKKLTGTNTGPVAEEPEDSNSGLLDDIGPVYDSPAAEAGAAVGSWISKLLRGEEGEDGGEKWYEGWFQKSQAGNGADTILGTSADLGTDLTTGLVGIGEKAVDAMAYLGTLYKKAQYGGGISIEADQAFEKNYAAEQKAVQEFIAQDLYDEEAVAKEIVSSLAGAAYATDPMAGTTDLLLSKRAKQSVADYMDDQMEADSVLGHKMDSLVQSAGQMAGTAALSALGVPAWLTMGAASFGAEAENAFSQGASYEEAGLSAAISAAAEVLSERISGGIDFGYGTLDDAATAALATGISNKVLRTAAKMGLDLVGEGSEEVISEFFGKLGSALYREEDLKEILFSEEAFDEYVEAFIGGAAMGAGGSVSNVVKSMAKGVDYATELTRNEQAVVEKVYGDEVARQEENGKRLTAKEKRQLYDSVVERMEKGYISTDTIEEVLGGDSYQAYKDTVDSEDSQIKQLGDQVKALEEAPNTVGNAKKYDALQSRLEKLKKESQRTRMKSQLGSEVSEMVKNDRLSESYNERGRRGEQFQADVSQYDAKQRATVQAAIDSGVLNNTNRSHELVDFVAKLSADKGVAFDFTNNEKLKETGFALEGVTVNGFVNDSGVTVNVNSAKALNSVVGHEITHVLEGTELYDALVQAITEYAKGKGDYDARLEQLTKLYEGKEGYTGEDAQAKIEQEVVADLVGDYLFTDKDFVQRLSTENRNVFQKIFDEIKYLCKTVTAGSKEGRQLLEVKKAFEEAYRAETKNPTGEGGVKYSLSSIVGASGRNYGVGVYLDSTLLSNLTEDERIDMVKEYVKELGGSVFTAYDNNGNAVDIHIVESSKKFKNKSGKRVPVNKDLTYRLKNEVKQEAIALVDELVQASTYHGREPATHPHDWVDDNGANDWDLWKTYIQDKQNTVWEASLRIANSANGDKILYDIFPIKMVEGAGTAATTTTNNNIAPTTPNVNGKNSLSDSTQSDDIGPLPWQIKGEDVALADDFAPISDEVIEDPFRGESLPGDPGYAMHSEEEAIPEDIAPPPGWEPASTKIDDIAPLPEGYQSDMGDTPEVRGKERKWIKTSTESDAVDGKVLPEDLDQDLTHYQPISNKKTLGNANAKLEVDGYETSLADFKAKFRSNDIKLDDIALGERLIQEAVKRGDTKTAGDLIMDISILGTELGQKVQALSIIKRLTPEGQLKMLQKTVERGKRKGDKAFEGVEITQEMIDYILKTYGKDGTYDQAELNERVEDVKQQIANQMSVSAMDYINEWRYLSMLGNPKTHIRNMVSNAAMWATRQAKNAMARTIEDIAPIENRTKTWKRASEDVIAYAKQVTEEMYKGESDNKYSEAGSIKAKRQIFKTKAMDRISQFNSDALSGEDTFFSKPAFREAFREYLTANGIRTKADIEKNSKLIAEAKQYAMEQAKEATFQQDSYIASKISEIERKNPLLNMAIGSVLPFKKTPINIAKTAVSYSPLGFARNIYDAVQVGKGNMEASEAIDHLAQTLTGTSLTLIGYALASMGVLNGAGTDDKEGEYDYQLGEQSYSFNFNGDTFSLSWLSPVAMPLFVGANAYEQLVEDKDWDWNVVSEALAQTLDPLSEMSFLSSLADVLSSYDSGMAAFGGMLESAAQSYITSFVPTLSSQIAQVTDDTKRSTKISANSGWDFGEETWNKIKYKIPGLRQTLEPSTDIWGNENKQSENVLTRALETFLAPYARREGIATAVDEEIKSLYAQTGDNGLIPSIPSNYLNYDGVKYEMSASEFTEFKKMYGQTAYDLMEDLFDTRTYQNADSETRAEMVNMVYDYARDEARRKYFSGHGVEFTNSTKDNKEYYRPNAIKGAIEHDMPVDEYKFYTANPEKYNFLRANGVTYSEFQNGGEEFKDAYNWAYNNPEKYEVSKAVCSDVVEYRKYTSELNDIRADKDENGKVISGSAKEKKIDYINGLDLEYGEKIILFKSLYESDDTYNYEIVDYLNSRSDISAEEMRTILTELGFNVDSEGKITWD